MRHLILRSKAVFMIVLIVAVSVAFSIVSNNASAQVNSCCEKTKSNLFCVYTDYSECDSSFQDAAFIPCEQTPFCKVGCCISPDGFCSMAVSKANCLSHNGYSWDEDASCSIDKCKKGCCVIGEAVCEYTTETNCGEITKDFPDVENEFRDVGSAIECTNICRAAEKGCCVGLNKCSYVPMALCPMSDIDETTGMGFYLGTYCSIGGLNEKVPGKVNCGCEEHFEKKCIDGESDVFWFDSCGNREEVAEDCSYVDGTLCGTDDEHSEPYCKITECTVTYKNSKNVHDYRLGGPRINGESWCIYEGPVGDFKDYPGSQHFRHMCVNGEEMVEPCRDFRQQVCLQYPLYSVAPGTAACLPNGIYDSTINVNITSVPQGDEFWDPEGSGLGATCSRADSTCDTYWVKKDRDSPWNCEVSCDCSGQGKIDEQAKYCRTLGDCGADYNVLGKRTTESFWVDGEIGSPSDTEWDTDNFAASISHELLDDWGDDLGVFGGMMGLAVVLIEKASEAPEAPTLGEEELATALTPLITVTVISMAYGATVLVGAAVYTLIVTMFPAVTAGMLASVGGIGGMAMAVSTAAISASASLGAVIGEGAATWLLLPVFGGIPGIGWILIAISALFIIYMVWASGGGGVEETSISTHCEPWVPPDGGSDCSLCDKPMSEGGVLPDIDGEILQGYTCSEYKCRSLGKTCAFIEENEGSGRPTCYNAFPNDVRSPAISPWEDILEEGYSISSYANGFEIEEEIKPHTKFVFGIKIDELAQCRIDIVHTESYDEMYSYFGGNNYYETDHNMSITVFPGESYEYFVRCKDSAGNVNLDEYQILFKVGEGPDLTVPFIEGTSTANGAFVAADANYSALYLFLNEAASCRWNKEDKDYELMPRENGMICNTNPVSHLQFSFKAHCLTALPVKLGQNTYYFRCKDLSNNTMSESYEFSLVGTNPLLITQAGPEGEVYENDITLKVWTSGGAEGGKATCFMGILPFFKTNSNYHEQQLYSLGLGSYSYKAKCFDKAANNATKEIAFRVMKDLKPPVITGFYTISNNLYVLTNELAGCEFSNQPFSFGSGADMQGNNTIVHSIPIQMDEYHLICRDGFGNAANEVTVFVP